MCINFLRLELLVLACQFAILGRILIVHNLFTKNVFYKIFFLVIYLL